MSQRSKRELFAEVQPSYLQATKVEKQRKLDEFTAATGYHRKYAVRVLKHGYPGRKLKRAGRQALYRGEVLEEIWEIYGRICSKRLHPYLPEGIKVLERCGEIALSAPTKELLLSISRSTIDRCLAPVRFKAPHGLSTTKPGTLLKKHIPIRTFANWNEEAPGFMEIDLVAHCGDSTEGPIPEHPDLYRHLHWLDRDHRSPQTNPGSGLRLHCRDAARPAFDLLGIDLDNGSEFINDLLYRYCLNTKITFTRSRPYKKNDQAHVEQKNWSVVRHTIGYDRLETDEEYLLLERIYTDLCLYINFFQPVLKLIGKERIGNRTLKRYDTVKAPYQRVLERKDIALEAKPRLMNLYLSLNPAELRRRIDQKTAKLWKISR